MVYSFRSCEDAGPRTLEAYGLAQYNPDGPSLTIHDELDTIHKPKTYMTTYAKMGWCGEEIDWNKKIYVYVTESYVSVISNVNLDRANALQFFCAKLAYHNFIRSFTPWVMFVIGFIVLLLFIHGTQLVEKGNPRGLRIVNSIWWGILIVFVFNFFHLFDFMAQNKDSNPVVVSVSDDDLSLNLDVVTGQEFEDVALKTFYEWEGNFIASSSKLRDTDVALMKCSYLDASKLLVRTIVLLTLICLGISARKQTKSFARKLSEENKQTSNNGDSETKS